MGYTIYDIAKELGISAATVSRALNGSELVKLETKEQILKLMKEKNYIPNGFARGLNNKSMKIIGVLISDVANPFYAEVVQGISLAFQKSNYTMVLCSTLGDLEVEKNEISILLEKQVDGLILIGSRYTHDKNRNFIIELSHRYPIIMVNSFIEGGDKIYSVQVDEEKAAYDVISYLFSRGEKNVFLLGDSRLKTTTVKLDALKRYMMDNGLSFSPSNMIDCYHSYAGGIAAAGEVIKKGVASHYALFPTSDMIAIGLISELSKNGIRVPNDLSVIGFGNMEVSSLIMPSLSTVDQKMFSMGEKAAEVLVDVLNGEPPVNKRTMSRYELIIRDSTF